VDLFSEQDDVRESVKRNLYTGRTYNSVENIAQFFAERGMPAPSGFTRKPDSPATPVAKSAASVSPPAAQRPASPSANPQPSSHSLPQIRRDKARRPPGFSSGTVVQHPKYGRGIVLRREGDGEDAKLTISFQGHGLKKIVEKFAGIRIEE
jgi:DNA helicase-2/ATP-dependent DNA helicase PcrA